MKTRDNRLSKSVSEISDHYTVVVIGSGYGGSIAASRMARTGNSVCLLERGKEIRPGEYPENLTDGAKQIQLNSAAGHYGEKTGMFEFHMNDDVNALVGCGLGGTSLINANVALEATDQVFEQEHWPIKPEDLAPYYERARVMLGSKSYPEGQNGFPKLNKLEALKASAGKMGEDFYLPKINVTFKDGPNAAGIEQRACTLCGNCCSGCNYSAKNTTLMNYLPDAVNHGAEIFTCARVEDINKGADGLWTLNINDLSTDAPNNRKVTADIVFVCAGSLGSAEILLRSRKRNGLSLSDRLGQNFSGNGDALGFGYNSYWESDKEASKDKTPVWKEINGVGWGENSDKEIKPGPCITGVIDMRATESLEDSLVIEEGVIPGMLASILPPLFFFEDAQKGHFLKYGVKQAAMRLADAQKLGEAIQNNPGSMDDQSYSGPIGKLQTYLVMSHDDAGGELKLEDDRLRIHWPKAGRSKTIKHDNRKMEEASVAIQGQYIPNPTWNAAMNHQIVTVHPVGGCGMAQSADKGVVNTECQVFTGQGTDVHEGLYVCDGAVMPGSLSVNPLLTISAIAERTCDLLARKKGWTINQEPGGGPNAKPQEPAAYGKPVPKVGMGERIMSLFYPLLTKIFHWMVNTWPDYYSPSLQFTESMHGYVTDKIAANPTGPRERISNDFALSYATGMVDKTTMSFTLTIHSDNLHQLTTGPEHSAEISGTVFAEELSKKPMKVLKGSFNLFTPSETQVETWDMKYRLLLERENGTNLEFSGTKYLHQKPHSHYWNDITILYTTVTEEGKDTPLLEGILELDMTDAVRMSNKMKIEPPSGKFVSWLIRKFPEIATKIELLFMAKFVGFFGMKVFQSYGNLLANLENFPYKDNAARKKRKLKAPEPEIHPIKLDGGGQIKLTRYNGGDKGNVVLAPGYSATSSSFAIDTVDRNLVEHLTAEGYDVWLFAYRGSPDSGNKQTDYNVDDIACVDWPTAVSFIREKTGKDMQVIAHCVGSMSLLMAILAAENHEMDAVSTVISSQLTLHPVSNWLNNFKADLNIVPLLEKEIGAVVDLSAAKVDQWDVAYWNIPVPKGEECKNPVCHRVFSVFGPSYAHAQLNHITHDAMCEMFGPIALKAGEQLTDIIRTGYAVNKDGKNVYLPNVEKLDIPITFFAGELNQIFFPETSSRTFAWLKAHHPDKPEGFYQREIVPDYAHMDLFIGRDTGDFFKRLSEVLDQQREWL